MGAKDVASKVEEIKTQKVHKEAAKEGGPKEKERRNGRNVHKMQRCMAIGLKQCPKCKNIIRSVCSKLSCRVDGTKPVIILSAVTRQTIPKSLFDCDSDESDVSQTDESDVMMI